MDAPDSWVKLSDAAKPAIRAAADHPTILEQIDAVEWAEAQAGSLRHSAALAFKQSVGLPGRHRTGLTVTQLDTLRRRLEAASETLRTLDFMRETLA